MFRKLKFFILLLAISLLTFNPVFAASTTDEAVLGNDRWSVTNGGDFIPNANTYSIGSATQYPESIWVNGAEYSSFAAGTDGNWTDQGTTTTLDQAPTAVIITHATGDVASTGFTVGTGDITFAQGGKLDGDTNGTLKLIEASDTLSFIFSGSTIQLDSSDGGFQFAMSNETEGYVDFLTNNDTDDYLRISTVANVPTIVTAGTSNLEIAPDGGTTTVTGALTATGLTTTAGLTTSTTVTLQNSETIINSTNGTVEVGGATNPILSVKDDGTSDSDATLQLISDAAGDNGDTWQIQADGGTQDLLVRNNASGSQATLLTIADTTALVTTAGDVIVAGTTPLLTVGDGGDEDAGIQINSDTNDFYIASENSADDLVIGYGSAIGTTPIISMTDAGVTTVTGSTDGELNIYGAGTTASDAYLRLIGDADADATDAWQLMNDSSGAALIFGNDSSVAGTYVTKFTLASSGLLTMVNGETINNNTADDTVTIASDDASLITKLYSPNATNGTVALQLVGDAQADATDSFQIINNADGTLTIGNDSTAAGTYITKASLDSTGAFIIEGSEATAGSIAIWSDNGDDAADKFTMSMSAADALTMTTGTTEAQSIATDGTTTLAAATVTGATALNGTVGLGNAVGDIVTVTGKVAGATPLSFDGNTADSVYTIFAMDDPASSSKTITFPAVTGTVKLSSAAVALTPGAAVTLTVAKGTTLYTDTVTDNEDQTITFSGAGSAGDEATIIFTTAGASDEVITFQATLVSSVGTLTLGTDAGKYYVIKFVSNGSHWFEVSRTAVQT